MTRRITSAPEPGSHVPGPSADDPASAQAVPDRCPDCGPYAPCPRHDESSERAAVRAALEGLRAEVAQRWYCERDAEQVHAIIDARLADLP